MVLPPIVSHSTKTATSTARQLADKLLAERGAGPRHYKNALVFLAADSTRLNDLEQAVRQLLAWTSIDEERDVLNLDAFQAKQAHAKRQQAEEVVKRQIPERSFGCCTRSNPIRREHHNGAKHGSRGRMRSQFELRAGCVMTIS